MKTIFSKPNDVKHDWYIIDASGKNLGRVAAKAASVLRGKHKPSYEPNVLCGDYVVIINADKVQDSSVDSRNTLLKHFLTDTQQILSEGQSQVCFPTTVWDARSSATSRFMQAASTLMPHRTHSHWKCN